MSSKSEISSVQIREPEFIRLLGYPADYEIGEESRKLMQWAESWYEQHGQPYLRIYPVKVELKEEGLMTIDDKVLKSPELWQRFSGRKVKKGVIVAASAGGEVHREIKKLWKEGYPDKYYFLEMYTSAIVEELITSSTFKICADTDAKGLSVLPRYSPGYSGWDLSCQKDLYHIIDQKDSDFKEHMGILDSGMLSPKKSQFSFIGLSEKPSTGSLPESPCSNCAYTPCQYRREPYESSDLSGTPQINYDFRESVLEKWSKDRLTVKKNADNTLRVVFKNSGSTCGNMGWPLAFFFNMSLKPVADGYLVEEATTVSTDQHEGYKKMCQYIAEGESFIETISQMQEVKGKFLQQLIKEFREHAPSGCLCSENGQKYFWNRALQTTHYYISKNMRS